MKSRRQFLQEMAALGVVVPASTVPEGLFKHDYMFKGDGFKPGPVCVFSKHLQFLDYDEMAETAAEIGFDGVDIPVRPKGHVLPENVARDLPKAVRAVEKAGLKVPMITTAISDADDKRTHAVLEQASVLGVKYYRPNWFPYDFEKGIIPSLDVWKKRIEKLAKLNSKYGIRASYQNHAGMQIGASLWDSWYMLKDLDHPDFGLQFDIRHAVVEGGRSWPVSLQLVAPFINTLVIKDFHWGKIDGKWELINVPVGAGMVDFNRYFKMLDALGIGGPISMHFEYEITDQPEETLGKKEAKRQVKIKMKKDLEQLRGYLKNVNE